MREGDRANTEMEIRIFDQYSDQHECWVDLNILIYDSEVAGIKA